MQQSRRSLAERAIARAQARGTPIDQDPEFMNLVELWVESEIDSRQMRQRYLDLLAQRRMNSPAQLAARKQSGGMDHAESTSEAPDVPEDDHQAVSTQHWNEIP
jgi:hypothetical protein